MSRCQWTWRLIAGVAAGAVLVLAGGAAVAWQPAFAVTGSPEAAPSGPAELTITVRTCPAGYDPTAAGADYRRDCREPAGDTNFRVDPEQGGGPSASTGTSGDAPQESTVRFSQLAPGRYTVTAEAPAEIGSAFIGACTSNGRAFDDYPFTPFATVGADGKIGLELRAGESLACDWYQIAADKAR